MHNLQPAVGEVNADRSNFRYDLFTNTYNQYGKCDVAIDFVNKRVQPREAIRGVIARSYLYMQQNYNIKLKNNDQTLMMLWHKKYPPDDFECKRNQIIKQLQGNDNAFITSSCCTY